MSSFVFYRFKSQKEPSRISFDGTGISVWDLKKEIIQENKMGKGTDFDFAIYNADTEEEYTEDHQIIPRSTSVLARRLPPARPGRGNAQKYMPSMEGAGPTSGSTSYGQMQSKTWNANQFTKRFDGKDDAQAAAPQAPVEVKLPAAAGQDEASALAAMFAASSQQWQQTQEQMAQATPVYRAPQGRPGAQRPATSQPGQAATPGAPPNPSVFIPGTGPDSTQASRYHQDRAAFRYSEHKPPPPGYICYRCGQKGHWIQECPTNNDRAYDDRPRIKRTTGIPKSFLTVVEGPDAPAEGAAPGASGIMVTAEGGFVVAKPDSASWLAHRALTKNLSAKDVQDLAPTDPDLTCPICSKLLRDATLTPCCSTSFCEECITNSLIDNDKLCPECETRVKNLDKLKKDEVRREKVKKYIDDVVEASKDVKEEGEEDGTGEDDKKVGDNSAEDKVKAEDGSDDKSAVVQKDDDQADANTKADSSGTSQPMQPMNPQAFAAQQLAMQQQQMMQLMIAQAGGPQMMMQQLQAQVMALTMQLQNNPNLPPPVRVQMMAQVQMCQQQYFVVQRMMQQQFQQQQQIMAARAGGGGMNGRQGNGALPIQSNLASPVVNRSATPQTQEQGTKRSREEEETEEQRKKTAVAGA
ncbi:Protein mpe1 [Microbotryomycetes sp. JL201]|nr:Protein mpe1 [Microbotryomycetes sp. JL201]